jgi:hypothetical protein
LNLLQKSCSSGKRQVTEVRTGIVDGSEEKGAVWGDYILQGDWGTCFIKEQQGEIDLVSEAFVDAGLLDGSLGIYGGDGWRQRDNE